MFGLGAAGVAEEGDRGVEPPTRQTWDDGPPEPPSPTIRLRAWFESPDDDLRAAAEACLPPAVEARWEAVPDEDWSTAWRVNFPVFRAGRLVVSPPWEEVPGSLILEPGQGFGTGQHATTRLVLERLVSLLDLERDATPRRRVLDVGCGSGILSLAAAHLGADAYGIDHDPFAVEGARAQAVRNGLSVPFDTTPLAAASIGQVYRAALPDGTPVAVKVQRPGVTETMEIDLEILVDLGRRISAHTQWGKDYDVSALTQEFADVLRAELDYTHEGRSMDRFREAFADDPQIVIPEVFWDHSTSRVLTMSFIDGVPATKLEEGDVEGVDRVGLVEEGVGAYFKQIFDLGFYHADPHAGNLFALPDGGIAFVDFGRTATVSRRNREAVFDMLLAVFDDDPRAATEAVLTMTGMPPEVDVARLEVELGRLLALYRRGQGAGGGLDDLVQRLLALVREHRLHLPTELTVLLTTLGMLDGVAAQLDPGFRMVDAAKPFAKKLLPQQFGPDRIFKATLRSARAYARFFDDLPVQATRVLRRAGEGEFRISVRPAEYNDLMERLQAGFSLLAYALIVSALIIGAAFLVGRVGLSSLEEFGARLVLLAALVSVVVLLFGLIRSEYRKWREAKRASG